MPESIKGLTRRHALNITDLSFHQNVTSLIAVIERVVRSIEEQRQAEMPKPMLEAERKASQHASEQLPSISIEVSQEQPDHVPQSSEITPMAESLAKTSASPAESSADLAENIAIDGERKIRTPGNTSPRSLITQDTRGGARIWRKPSGWKGLIAWRFAAVGLVAIGVVALIYIQSGKVIKIFARNYSSISGTLGVNVLPYGKDVLTDAPGMPEAGARTVSYIFEISNGGGPYTLSFCYAAAVSRPVLVVLNGKQADFTAAGDVTGGWYPEERKCKGAGRVVLKDGGNEITLQSDRPFPHIWLITFSPTN